MNDGIRYASRPSDTKPKTFGGLPPEVVGMARQMGLSPADVKQMSSMWSNMDELSESDPEGYKKFTEEILADGPPETGASSKARAFIPTPSFVVKAMTTSNAGNGLKVTTRSGLAKMFVNMASCEALEPPKDAQGRPMQPGERRGAEGLQIPLLVGEVRSCADHSGEAGAALAVDVVFHPWIIDRCEQDNTFKAQAIDLALGWVEQETGYKFERKWKTIKSKYKDGLGENDDEPRPFPVDRALEQDGPVGERRTPTPAAPGSSPDMASPESLLRAAAAVPPTATKPLDIKMPGSAGASLSSSEARVLIEEVAPKGKVKPAVKKGFLHAKAGKEAPRLYDETGSSGDGGKEGSYSRLMSKCQVVDMSTMSPEQQKLAMEKHAGTPGTAQPTAEAPREPTATAAKPTATAKLSSRGDGASGFDGLGKGFFAKAGGSLYGDQGSAEGAPLGPGPGFGTDALFDSLIAGIDPDYAAAVAPKEAADDPLGALGDIAKVLSGGMGGLGSSSGVSLEDQPPVMHTPLTGIDDSLPPPALQPMLQHEWTLSLAGSKRVGTLLVPLASMEGVDLEVSCSEVRVTTGDGRRAAVALPFTADADRTKAKYSKSSKTLKVTITEV